MAVNTKTPSLTLLQKSTSPAMQELLKRLKVIAGLNIPVMINGETGVGKEVFAQAIHEASRRRGPFVAVNCAALPSELIESMLFGHVKGSFTGAGRETKGLFREAEGGSIFLDEVTEMPIGLQAKLLRALQQKTVMPVGGASEVPFDARIISSSNRDIDAAVRDGVFREDLRYRLTDTMLAVPPLRERRSDISVLADHFLGATCKEFQFDQMSIDPKTLKTMAHGYDWPGNVRQLRSIVRASAIEARVQEDNTIRISHLFAAANNRDFATAIQNEIEHSRMGVSGREAAPSSLALDTVAAQTIYQTAKDAVADERHLYTFLMTHMARTANKQPPEMIANDLGINRETVMKHLGTAKRQIHDSLHKSGSSLTGHPLFSSAPLPTPDQINFDLSFYDPSKCRPEHKAEMAIAELILWPRDYALYGWHLSLPKRGMKPAYESDTRISSIIEYSALSAMLTKTRASIDLCMKLEEGAKTDLAVQAGSRVVTLQTGTRGHHLPFSNNS